MTRRGVRRRGPFTSLVKAAGAARVTPEPLAAVRAIDRHQTPGQVQPPHHVAADVAYTRLHAACECKRRPAFDVEFQPNCGAPAPRTTAAKIKVGLLVYGRALKSRHYARWSPGSIAVRRLAEDDLRAAIYLAVACSKNEITWWTPRGPRETQRGSTLGVIKNGGRQPARGADRAGSGVLYAPEQEININFRPQALTADQLRATYNAGFV
ncbi:hypothetical protein EVAR_2968_1 [Eumeta japonica]|uniref:Uncharacterized protein n=1 Tax=Eumeta variegata TaxID=151549 RepID=A0A4C1STZ8_EUMVA|nr:hypothetical protein EVAR_2968_1 [Eumeta japonica]